MMATCPKCGREEVPLRPSGFLGDHNEPPNEDGYVGRCGNRRPVLATSRPTPFERLLKRLEAQGVELPALTLHRTRAGWAQRSAGAWSWFALDAEGHERLAGWVPVGELLKAPGPPGLCRAL